MHGLVSPRYRLSENIGQFAAGVMTVQYVVVIKLKVIPKWPPLFGTIFIRLFHHEQRRNKEVIDKSKKLTASIKLRVQRNYKYEMNYTDD